MRAYRTVIEIILCCVLYFDILYTRNVSVSVSVNCEISAVSVDLI